MPQFTIPYSEPLQDKRRKIHPKDHAQIKRDYNELKSYQKTADLWGVSKRLIIFIVNPDIKKRYSEYRKRIQSHKIYYNTQKRKMYMRTFRKRKRELGLLTSKKPNS